MEENILEPVPEFKLYNEMSVRIGTFIGGPLVAGLMIAENFKQLGQHEKVKNTWLISVAVTVLVFGCAFFIPGIERLSPYLIPLCYGWAASLLMRHFQGKELDRHQEKGGQLYSAWRVALITLIGLLISVAVFFILISLSDKQFTW